MIPNTPSVNTVICIIFCTEKLNSDLPIIYVIAITNECPIACHVIHINSLITGYAVQSPPSTVLTEGDVFPECSLLIAYLEISQYLVPILLHRVARSLGDDLRYLICLLGLR